MRAQIGAVAVTFLFIAFKILRDVVRDFPFPDPVALSVSLQIPQSSCPFYNCHVLCVDFTSKETVLPSPTTEIFIVLQSLAQAHCLYILRNVLLFFPFIINLFTSLLYLWVVGFLMEGVLSCLGQYFKLFVSLSERKADREPQLLNMALCQLLWGCFLTSSPSQP